MIHRTRSLIPKRIIRQQQQDIQQLLDIQMERLHCRIHMQQLKAVNIKSVENIQDMWLAMEKKILQVTSDING